MKHYIPYIISAVIGFFICPVSCLLSGIYYYEFGWTEPLMALFFLVLTWCWRGENGIYADIKQTLRSLRGGGRDDS